MEETDAEEKWLDQFAVSQSPQNKLGPIRGILPAEECFWQVDTPVPERRGPEDARRSFSPRLKGNAWDLTRAGTGSALRQPAGLRLYRATGLYLLL